MATLETQSEIAEGVHRCGSRHFNWYLVEGDDELAIYDTGNPAHWEQLLERLAAMDYDLSDVSACLLTHAHPDHIGFARRLHEEAGVPLLLHEAGVQRARDGGDPPVGEFVKHAWRPAFMRFLVDAARSGGFSTPPVTTVEPFADGEEFDVPGQPRAIHVPGHTEGEVVFYLPEREVLLCGDAFATVEFETWSGNTPQLLPSWLNHDHEQARDSLSRLDSLGEVVLLPGHGDPWTGRMSDAVQSARHR